MREILNVTKAMADGNRLRILMSLRDGELCVCQIVELLQLAPSTTSKHMSILRQAQLVESRKEGRWMYYRLPDNGVPRAVQGAIAWATQHLAGVPQIVQDGKQLKKILAMDPETLCKRQCRS